MGTFQQIDENNLSRLSQWKSAAEESWYAIATRSRHEKVVASQLAQKRINTFLPLVKAVHRWTDRRKVVEEPLFGGYVFVRIPMSSQSRISVLRTLGVVQFIGIEGRPVPIPDKQIEDVQTLLSSDVAFGDFPFLRLGHQVRIRGGCLDGIEGILVAKNADRSVIVSVDLIQRSLEIHVSGFDLEAI